MALFKHGGIMKTKMTFYYIPTFARMDKMTGLSTIPGPVGIREETRRSYFFAFMGNMWPVRDFDIPVWVLPVIGAAALFLGFILV